MARYLLVIIVFAACVALSSENGLLFTRVAKQAAEQGESLCGNFTRGNTVYLEQHAVTPNDTSVITSGNLSSVWRGFVGLRNNSRNLTMTFRKSENCTYINGTQAANCTGCILGHTYGWKNNSTTWFSIEWATCSQAVCAKKDLLAFQSANKTWIGKCIPVGEGNITVKRVQAIRTDVFLKSTPKVGSVGASEECDSDVTVWDFKKGCKEWANQEWSECGNKAWGLSNLFTFGGRSVHWITELEINSNHMECKVNKLANMTTAALRLLNDEEGDLREATLDNRLALELLLARSGGLCKYIGRQSCCTDVPDFQKNISEILEKMHQEIANYQRVPVSYGLNWDLGALFNWLHWGQWLPIIVLCVVACVFLRR